MNRSTLTCRSLLALIFTALLVPTVAGCGDSSDQAEVEENSRRGGKADDFRQGDGLGMCAGLRGNGQLIFSHFGSLARIHEEYGMLDGVAGGSSGSISSFLTESIYTNPHVYSCSTRTCTEDDAAARAALLFKSLLGYVTVLSDTDEATAIRLLVPVVEKARQQGMDDLIASGEFLEASALLQEVLTSPEVGELANPELVELLRTSPNPEFHVRDIWSALAAFGSFEADSHRIFVRPGIIDFNAFAEKIGRIGSFYAAYGPADDDAWTDFLDNCAADTRGMTWEQAAAHDPGDGVTCGARFETLATTWRAAFVADEDNFRSRIDDPVGAVLPALVSTSVLTGDAVPAFENARAQYLAGQEPEMNVDFEDVRFGYFGLDSHLDKVAADPEGFGDLKSKKFLPLRDASYRDALSLSPAEPGLTRALEIDDAKVSAGGWSDLSPSLVLANLGCEEVILVTRHGGEVGFGTQVASLLGMTGEQDAALYDLKGDSSAHLSLAEAEGRWCTNWNDIEATKFAEVFTDGYNAQLESSSDFFAGKDHPDVSSNLGRAGCTPGVPFSAGGE